MTCLLSLVAEPRLGCGSPVSLSSFCLITLQPTQDLALKLTVKGENEPYEVVCTRTSFSYTLHQRAASRFVQQRRRFPVLCCHSPFGTRSYSRQRGNRSEPQVTGVTRPNVTAPSSARHALTFDTAHAVAGGISKSRRKTPEDEHIEGKNLFRVSLFCRPLLFQCLADLPEHGFEARPGVCADFAQLGFTKFYHLSEIKESWRHTSCIEKLLIY